MAEIADRKPSPAPPRGPRSIPIAALSDSNMRRSRPAAQAGIPIWSRGAGADGLLMDIRVPSPQIDKPSSRDFRLPSDAPLDMRMDSTAYGRQARRGSAVWREQTQDEISGHLATSAGLAGEEWFACPIAKSACRRRDAGQSSTHHWRMLASRGVSSRRHCQLVRILQPRTFQALRISRQLSLQPSLPAMPSRRP